MFQPTLGRWMQEDPTGFAAGDANLYRALGNGPTNALDPMGFAPNLKPRVDPKAEALEDELNRLAEGARRDMELAAKGLESKGAGWAGRFCDYLKAKGRYDALSSAATELGKVIDKVKKDLSQGNTQSLEKLPIELDRIFDLLVGQQTKTEDQLKGLVGGGAMLIGCLDVKPLLECYLKGLLTGYQEAVDKFATAKKNGLAMYGPPVIIVPLPKKK